MSNVTNDEVIEQEVDILETEDGTQYEIIEAEGDLVDEDGNEYDLVDLPEGFEDSDDEVPGLEDEDGEWYPIID